MRRAALAEAIEPRELQQRAATTEAQTDREARGKRAERVVAGSVARLTIARVSVSGDALNQPLGGRESRGAGLPQCRLRVSLGVSSRAKVGRPAALRHEQQLVELLPPVRTRFERVTLCQPS